MKEKLEYLGLNLDKIPEILKSKETLNYRAQNNYDEKKYKQYKFVSVKDIEILLTPTNRLENISEKYSKSLPLYAYLLKNNKENKLRHEIFLNMLDRVDIEDIEKIDKEQQQLAKKIPFKVKYSGNFLWQIYYSEIDDKYFMLVPIEDSDYSTFFYVLKKKLEKRKDTKIFVPISNVNYSKAFLNKSEFEDLENYLWLFTKDWPSIYEVYNKKNELEINIVGETEVFGKIKSIYNTKLKDKQEAMQFYKLLKAIFILQTELPKFYKFQTNIGKKGEIEFYFENEKIEYEMLSEFVNAQYNNLQNLEKKIQKEKAELIAKLENLKLVSLSLEAEFLEKEKQITTFLECKKSFFGKVKYFFKYAKKRKNTVNPSLEDCLEENEVLETDLLKEEKNSRSKKQHTLDELVARYKEYELVESEVKDTIMDINAIKLKNKNLTKKIENATAFIAEIDSHKKSIFEFWKYSNKDEQTSLPEGEQEEVNIKKIIKIFDYSQDLEDFGKLEDKFLRKNLSEEELDSVYILTTNILEVLNKIKTNDENLPKIIETSLKALKQEAKEQSSIDYEDVDIFGTLNEDSQKIRKIASKNHREIKRDKFKILEIGKGTRQLGYKLELEKTIKDVESALKKSTIMQNLSAYKVSLDNLVEKEINIFNINPEKEMKKISKLDGSKINLYKMDLKKNANAIAFSNIIFYENQNRTLPVGMDLSTDILIDVGSMDLKLNDKKTFRMAILEDENDEFSDVKIKTINVFEYEQIETEL
jgi:hypothetical protein